MIYYFYLHNYYYIIILSLVIIIILFRHYTNAKGEGKLISFDLTDESVRNIIVVVFFDC
jgi:hypothetical protein